MKYLSCSDILFQSFMSAERSTSSVVQKDAMAFLYSFHRSGYFMGNVVKRDGFGTRIGSMCINILIIYLFIFGTRTTGCLLRCSPRFSERFFWHSASSCPCGYLWDARIWVLLECIRTLG